MAQRPYSDLGKIIDELARARNVKGAKAIAEAVADYEKDSLGLEEGKRKAPGRSAWQHILYGDSWPSPRTMTLFRYAMGLEEDEYTRLAVEYAFREEPVAA